jgi:CRISPR/Cas system CSM-associated protein Csm4 (group 5 of RAMP superfamily)
MRVYSVELKLPGEMSQLPDSQKIFGALVYLLAGECGKDAAGGFVGKVERNEIYFALSNLMPKGYLPVPKSFVEYRAVEVGNAQGKQIYSELKKRDFAKKEKIECYLKNPSCLLSRNRDDFVFHEIDQQVHVNTESRDERSGGEKNLIFSVQRTICKYNKGEGENVVKDYQFYIRCNADCKIMGVLQKKCDIGHVLALGKRASQGYNLFELTGIEEAADIEKCYPNSNRTYLNLGMLLPNAIDYKNEHTFLDLFSSERRTFSSDKWDNAKNRGHFISFIAPGSMVVADDVGKAGKCVPSPVRQNEIVFGNAFLLPWKVR